MKSYKEMAEMTETKIAEAIKEPGARPIVVNDLIESWLAFSERDKETTEAEKEEKYKKMLLYLEKRLEEINPYKREGDRYLNLVFSYVAIRQKLEKSEEDETEARLVRITP